MSVPGPTKVRPNPKEPSPGLTTGPVRPRPIFPSPLEPPPPPGGGGGGGGGGMGTSQPMTSKASTSIGVMTPSSPGARVGSISPIPRLSFQWLACWPSPKLVPVENRARLVAPLSMEKYLGVALAVQSMVAGAEKRKRSSGLTTLKALSGKGPPKGGLLVSRISTPLTKPRA